MAGERRAAWLANPQDQQVEMYKLGQEVEIRSLPTQLSGGAILPDFTLDLAPFESMG